MAVTTVIYGFLGFGALAGIAYAFTSWSGGKGDIKNALHNIMQKITQNKIKDTEKKQEEVKKKIINYEKLSEESQVKIKKIKQDSSKKIVKILEKESIAELDSDLDELWTN